MSRTTTGGSRPDRKRQKTARELVKLTRETDAPLSYQQALQALAPEGYFESALSLAKLLIERGEAAKIPDLIKDLVVVKVGGRYRFFCEMQQEYDAPAERLRRFTGQEVEVVDAFPVEDPDSSRAYKVRADDGTEFTVQEEELSGWDHALDQFFWPDGTSGKARSGEFLPGEVADIEHKPSVTVIGHGFSVETSLGEVLDQEFNGDINELLDVVGRLLKGATSVCVNEGHEHPRSLEVLDADVIRQQLEMLPAATPPVPVNCPGHGHDEDCEDDPTNPCSACVERGEADEECSRCGALRAKDQHGSAEDWCACEAPTSESDFKTIDEDLRGVFADGWTSEEADAVLPRVSQALGLELRATWEYVDERGTGGHSQIVAVTPDHIALVVPDGLMAFLEDGDGDGRINIPETFVADASVKPALMFALGDCNPDCNLVAEDRRPREIVREVATVVLTADKTTHDYADAAVALLGGKLAEDSKAYDFVMACPDDVPVETLEFLDGELTEAATHADEDGDEAEVCITQALALLIARHPSRVVDYAEDLYAAGMEAAALMYSDGDVPELVSEWISENLDGPSKWIYVAEFTPEAWIRDNAVEVDAEGPRTWDCTAFVNSEVVEGLYGEESVLGYLVRRSEERGVPLDEGVLDTDDVLKRDPAAPEWIRDWSGPFTIRVSSKRA